MQQPIYQSVFPPVPMQSPPPPRRRRRRKNRDKKKKKDEKKPIWKKWEVTVLLTMLFPIYGPLIAWLQSMIIAGGFIVASQSLQNISSVFGTLGK